MTAINIPKILHAYKLYYPHKGGVQTVMKQLAEGLSEHYSSEILVSLPHCGIGSQDVINNIPIKRESSLGTLLSLPIAPFYPIQFWRDASRVNIVHYHFPMPWIDLAVSLNFPKKTKLIVHWHSDIIAQKKTAYLLSPCIHRCLKRADRIIVTSPQMFENSRWLKNYREKCTVIPLGVNVGLWDQLTLSEQDTVTELRKQYPQLILAVGRLVAYKGFNVLIEAMRKIKGHLIIIGRGVEEQNLRKMISNYGLSDRIQLLDDVTQEQLKCFYHAANFFAFPSISENEAFGIVQLEAMACGKAIINTHLSSGVTWVARHEQEAITIPPNQVAPLVKAMQMLLNQNELADKLGKNGYKRVQEEFGLNKLLKSVGDVYGELGKA